MVKDIHQCNVTVPLLSRDSHAIEVEAEKEEETEVKRDRNRGKRKK